MRQCFFFNMQNFYLMCTKKAVLVFRHQFYNLYAYIKKYGRNKFETYLHSYSNFSKLFFDSGLLKAVLLYINCPLCHEEFYCYSAS